VAPPRNLVNLWSVCKVANIAMKGCFYMRGFNWRKTAITGLLTAALVYPMASAAISPGQGYAATNIDVYLQGLAMSLDASAHLDNGVTMVPLRNLAEALGATVEWESDSQSAVIRKDGLEVKLGIGQSSGWKNGNAFDIGGAPKLQGDVLMVPVRAISETFQMLVRWDGTEQAVYIDDLKQLPVVGSLNNLKSLMEEAQKRGELNGGYGIATDSAMRVTTKAMAPESAPASAGSSAPPAAAMDMSAKSAESTSSSVDYSKTNTQVQGVDEADVVKTDGKYIYQVNRERIVITEAQPADQMKIVSTLEFGDREKEGYFSPREIYVDDKHLIVIGGHSRYSIYPAEGKPGLMVPQVKMIRPRVGMDTTRAIIYELGDRSSLKQVREIELEGGYVSSRKIGSSLYMVTNKYLDYWTILKGDPAAETVNPAPSYRDSAAQEELQPIDFKDIRYFPESVDPNYMVVAGVNLDRPDQPAQVGAYLGSGHNIYASDKHLYVSVTRYERALARDSATSGSESGADVGILPQPWDFEQKTSVHKFRLDQGSTTYVGQGDVPGTILNQFSMDEHDGYFRIATTTGDVWATGANQSKNHVYILDEGLTTIGKLENLAPGEKIYSVRFMGNRAYIVTFKTVDPLFVIDLANPKEPSVLGALKIPGYSDYLHPYDENHIIGFGKDTVEMSRPDGQGTMAYYLGMKMAMFDVSDVSHPKELFKEMIGDRGTDSELLHNHKALLFSKEHNLLAFPVQLHEVQSSDTSNAKSKLPMPDYGQFTFQGAYVYNLDLTNGFKLKGRITHLSDEDLRKAGMHGFDYNYNVNRILYIGDSLYTLSQGKIKANDMATLKEQGSLMIP
jgi:inhibitor of cysteine peptidase